MSRTQKEVRELLRKYDDDFDELVQALFDAAKGLRVEKDDGEIYRVGPDIQAAKVLMEYRFGKPSRSDTLESGTGSKKIVYNFINVQNQPAQVSPPEDTEVEVIDES